MFKIREQGSEHEKVVDRTKDEATFSAEDCEMSDATAVSQGVT